MGNVISTGMGDFSKDKFNALLNVRSAAMTAIRTALSSAGFTEVSTSSLVNIAGSCENPYASFSLPFYGREAHLSQSAQLQLEAIVMRLRRSVFTVNSSFREENFDDPEAEGRRLSEFTLIEPEMPLVAMGPEAALDAVIQMQELVLKASTRHVLETCEKDVTILLRFPPFRGLRLSVLPQGLRAAVLGGGRSTLRRQTEPGYLLQIAGTSWRSEPEIQDLRRNRENDRAVRTGANTERVRLEQLSDFQFLRRREANHTSGPPAPEITRVRLTPFGRDASVVEGAHGIGVAMRIVIDDQRSRFRRSGVQT